MAHAIQDSFGRGGNKGAHQDIYGTRCKDDYNRYHLTRAHGELDAKITNSNSAPSDR